MVSLKVKITTAEFAPVVTLAPLVRCYTWREFDTAGMDMIRPWHASHELSLSFFFSDLPVHLLDPAHHGITARGSRSDIVGAGTQYNGEMLFNGRYAVFEIIFRAGGFYHLFRIPPTEVTNHIVNATDALGPRTDWLFEQLSATDGLPAKAALADAFLLGYHHGRILLPGHAGLCAVPGLLLRRGGPVDVQQMADEVHMSVRNFERRFIQQVGISPKLFACVERFNQALTMKLQHPTREWTAIAAECSYFDQMHLIKDFKRFGGDSPAAFMHETPLTHETYTNRLAE